MDYSLTPEFEDGLKRLDMLPPDSAETSGLVFLKDFPPPNIYERIVLEKAQKYEVDAVYFRRLLFWSGTFFSKISKRFYIKNTNGT